MLQISDKVRYLNAVGGGVVVKIEKDLAYVDEDGFETPVLIRECVVVEPANPAVEKAQKSPKSNVIASTPFKPQPETPAQPEPKPEETPDGDRMNVVLAFVPEEEKHLNTTRFDSYLVNDSNYYIYFTYLSRDEEGWRTRYAGIVEPNIQLHLEEFGQDEVNSLERICIQYIAFKKDKHFALKSPVAVEHRIDPVKFYKLHSFRENLYFDEPAMVLDIVKNDIPVRPLVVDASDLERAMKAKKAADTPDRKPVVKREPASGLLEVDLHIHELLDSTTGLSNADMLNYQLKRFREVLEENKRFKGKKIVFIHGKGEGVLRNAIINELRSKYKSYTYQDASFREYGFGATMVTIH